MTVLDHISLETLSSPLLSLRERNLDYFNTFPNHMVHAEVYEVLVSGFIILHKIRIPIMYADSNYANGKC